MGEPIPVIRKEEDILQTFGNIVKGISSGDIVTQLKNMERALFMEVQANSEEDLLDIMERDGSILNIVATLLGRAGVRSSRHGMDGIMGRYEDEEKKLRESIETIAASGRPIIEHIMGQEGLVAVEDLIMNLKNVNFCFI